MQNVTPSYPRISSRIDEKRLKQTTPKRRSKYWLGIIIPNYSIPIFPDISEYLTKVSYFRVVSHCPLTHYLIIHLRAINKERFIKQFYWPHSIQFTSSNSLCCSLYPPPPVLYYTYNLFRSDRFDLFDLY